jgi:hypothetical protein
MKEARMTDTFDPIDLVRQMAHEVASAKDAEIATAIFELASQGVDHALIHVYEWPEPVDLRDTECHRITVNLALRPEIRDSGGFELGFHPYGQMPDDDA